MIFDISHQKDYVVFILKGNLIESPDATEFYNTLKNLIGENRIKIIIDLRNISYVNSTGLSIIFQGNRMVNKAGGEFKLTGLNTKMKNLLNITRLDSIFDIYDSIEEAINNS